MFGKKALAKMKELRKQRNLERNARHLRARIQACTGEPGDPELIRFLRRLLALTELALFAGRMG